MIWSWMNLCNHRYLSATVDVYVDNSEDDLSEWQREEMDPDEELNTLMHFVFASDSGTEDLVSPETEVTFTHR